MDKDICLKKICSLPLDLKTENKSPSTLIAESYYYIFFKSTSILDIKNYLKNHPSLIKEWEEWSNNKQAGQGVYLSLIDNIFIVGKIDPNGKKIFEKIFDSNLDACAEYVYLELIELIISTDIKKNIEKEFDMIINASIEIGNLIIGNQISQENQFVYLAEGLGQKIINHTLTVRYLFNGYQLGNIKHLFEPKVDYSSIIVLTRAALETYLTLNYVFVAEGNEEKKQFRFLCWDLAGYIERSNFHATSIEHITRKQNEALSIESIRKHLIKNPYFNTLAISEQKKAIKGEWRLNYKWHDLATKAGFNKDYFIHQYKFLCSYAHASRLSVIQIQQSKTFEQQKEMATSAIGILMVVLAKHMHDYIEIMPLLQSKKQDMPTYPIIDFWKTIGEKLSQAIPEELGK